MFSMVAPQTASAQKNLFAFAPLTISPRYDHLFDPTVHQIAVDGALTIQVLALIPSLSPQSSFSLLPFSVGVRFGNTVNTDFRWRAGLIDLNLYRTRATIGFTLVDYDRSGVRDVHARWLGLRLGPSLRLGGDTFYLVPRVVGSGALSTFKLGNTNYAALGPNASKSTFGFELNYRLQLAVHLGTKLTVSGDFGQFVHFGGTDPRLNTNGLEALFLAGAKTQFFVRFEHEETKLDDTKQDLDHFRIGLRFTPAASTF